MSSRRAVDFARLVLPRPTDSYNVDYMRKLVDQTQLLLGTRIGKDEWSTLGFGGIPLLAWHGTNAAFAIVSGAAASKLPFTVSDIDTDKYASVRTATNDIQTTQSGTYLCYCYLAHNANPPLGYGTDNKVANVHVYKNGVELSRIARLLVQGAAVDATFAFGLAPNDVIDIRLSSPTLGFNVDMTLSSWTLFRTSQDSRLGVL